MSTGQKIEQALREKLSAVEVEVVDESYQHRGHAGAAGGGGHFKVKVVSAAFAGKSLVEQHQMVYAALDEVMGDIHALSTQTVLPDH